MKMTSSLACGGLRCRRKQRVLQVTEIGSGLGWVRERHLLKKQCGVIGPALAKSTRRCSGNNPPQSTHPAFAIQPNISAQALKASRCTDTFDLTQTYTTPIPTRRLCLEGKMQGPIAEREHACLHGVCIHIPECSESTHSHISFSISSNGVLLCMCLRCLAITFCCNPNI